jgi:hypothetical protein
MSVLEEATYPYPRFLPRSYIIRGVVVLLETSPDGESVWGLLHLRDEPQKAGIFEVHLPDMTSTFLSTGEGIPNCAVRTKAGYYVSYDIPPDHFIERYDFQSRTWTKRRMTDVGASELQGAAGEVFMDLSFYAESGIAQYDWDHDKLDILASDRSNPPQNQLDGHTSFMTRPFSGSGGRPCLFFDGIPYYIQNKPGNWTRVDLDLVRYFQSITTVGRLTLLSIDAGEVVLLDPDKAEPTYLLAPDEPRGWHQPPGWNEPAKMLPTWASKTFWKFPSKLGRDLGPVSYYAGRLYSIDPPGRDRPYYQLFVWQPGNPWPSIIPLHFAVPGLGEKRVLELGGGPVGICPVRDGLCLGNSWGFWFVPYADIQAYLQPAGHS